MAIHRVGAAVSAPRRTFRGILLRSFLLFPFAFLLVIFLLFLHRTHTLYLEERERDMSRIGTRVAEHLTNTFEEKMRHFQWLVESAKKFAFLYHSTTRPDPKDFAQAHAEVFRTLYNFQSNNTDFHTLTLISGRGKELMKFVGSAETKATDLQDVRTTPYFQDIVRRGPRSHGIITATDDARAPTIYLYQYTDPYYYTAPFIILAELHPEALETLLQSIYQSEQSVRDEHRPAMRLALAVYDAAARRQLAAVGDHPLLEHATSRDASEWVRRQYIMAASEWQIRVTMPAVRPHLLFFQYKGMLVLVFAIAVITGGGVVAVLYRSLMRDLRGLVAGLQELGPSAGATLSQMRSQEFYEIARAFQVITAEKQQYQAALAQRQKLSALGEASEQIAHDLRSPLSSMEVGVRGLADPLTGLDHKSAQYVQLLQLSAKRLREIIHQLLHTHDGGEEPWTILSLHAVLDELIGEYQGREHGTCATFVKQYHDRALELYGQRTPLQRAIENMVTNALEAMGDRAESSRQRITMMTSGDPGHVRLTIADTGPGMTPEVLRRVLQGGYSAGKPQGHGIGMQVVQAVVATHGGRLEGESIVGQGTRFHLTFPVPTESQRTQSQREVLALQELRLPVYVGEPIVIVDDEASMREQWRVILAEQHAEVQVYTCFEEVERQIGAVAQAHTAIVDHHFANSAHHGFDVMRLLHAHGFRHLILCTAEYWKPSVQRQAARLEVQLCPKPVPAQIVVDRIPPPAQPLPTPPRLIGEPMIWDYVLIDDDPLIHTLWRAAGHRVQKAGQCFTAIEDFLAAASHIHKQTPIYVDVHLADQVRGDIAGQRIHELGFANIFLATGYRSERFRQLPWIKQVVSKSPPWMMSTPAPSEEGR